MPYIEGSRYNLKKRSAKVTEQSRSMVKQLNVALIGNPNTGKTSVFNKLTGLNQQVGNYPGITVEKKQGVCKLDRGVKAHVLD